MPQGCGTFVPGSRRRSTARDPTALDVRAIEDAKKGLSKHQDSLDDAKRARDANLEAGRNSLRKYKAALSNAVEERLRELEHEMKANEHFDAPFKDSKKLGKRVHSPTGPSKDM